MEINGQITANEISKSVKDLKIEKTCYDDNIINEYIKSSAYLLMPIYVKLFNCILVPGASNLQNMLNIFQDYAKMKIFLVVSVPLIRDYPLKSVEKYKSRE